MYIHIIWILIIYYSSQQTCVIVNIFIVVYEIMQVFNCPWFLKKKIVRQKQQIVIILIVK